MFARLKKSGLVLVLLALAAALSLAIPALAGGWVVITLDRLPEVLAAGETTTIGMMARQHGQTAWEVDALEVQARHVETGQQVSFSAIPQGAPGHYAAELVFPLAGDWVWAIGAGMFPDAQPMPVLTVSANPALASVEPDAGAVSPLTGNNRTMLLGVGALLAFASGLLTILAARWRRLPVLAGAGLMALCAGLAIASVSSANTQAREREAQAAINAKAAAVEDPVLVGQRLFLAKGCVICHTNDRAIQNSASYGVENGPNLTQYQNDPKVIHTKLKDPKAMNPAAKMPQLDLKVDEIEALVAFLNDHD